VGALVPKPDNIRLAMLGMTEGNGHPYSWSAIFNGYDRDLMTRECPFAAIPQYLNRQPPDALGIPGAQVTHICCIGDGGFTAEHAARCSRIPNVVKKPADVIGAVDAVLIATDKGWEHVERARPFVEAGLPVFIDKPLCDSEPDLKTFHRWVREGRNILTSSGMRYAKEFMAVKSRLSEIGEPRFLVNTTPKSWERYGIHAAEGLYPILGPGYISVRNTGSSDRNIVHCKHRCGADVILVASKDMYGGFCRLTAMGTRNTLNAACEDTFFAFKGQMMAFVNFLRTGNRPFPWSETVELMKILIAGIRSRDEGGREVLLDEIRED
jgi:predicted dehydrogenase